MLSFLQYLIALVIGAHAVAPPGVPPAVPRVGPIVVTFAVFAVLAALRGRTLARVVRVAADDGLPAFARTFLVGRIGALIAFGIVMQGFDGRELPAAIGVADWVLVPHLVRLAVFAAFLAILRVAFHPAGRDLGVVPDSAIRSVGNELGQALLPLGPILPVFALWDVFTLAPSGTRRAAAREILTRLPVSQSVLMLLTIGVALAVMPFILRVIWRARPMPPGPLRTRLEAYAERVNLHARDILVWPTGGSQVNAAVVGALPRLRYVFITDGLLETLEDDEIEAVFAHEAGHAKRGHVPLFFGFSCVLVLMQVLPGALGSAYAEFVASVHPLTRAVVGLLFWVGLVFGYVSRRFEQEADVFGIETLPQPAPDDGSTPDPADHPFGRALERIADEVGGIREAKGWRHFSIADRVIFVQAYLSSETIRRGYRWRVGALRGTLILAIAGFTLAALAHLPGELATVPARWRIERDPLMSVLQPLSVATQPERLPIIRAIALVSSADLARRAGRHGTALRWLREAARLAPDQPAILAAYGGALEGADRPRGARLVYARIEALQGVSQAVRDAARERREELAAEARDHGR